jgi:hypothetical protein
MNRLIYVAVRILVIAATAFGYFRWGLILLQNSGLGQHDHRTGLLYWAFMSLSKGELNPIPVGLILLSSIVSGFIVGPFLVPVVLLPFVSPTTFWRFHISEHRLKIPFVSAALEQWCTIWFGRKPP